MDPNDTKTRIWQAYKLLTQETTSRQKFEAVRTLIKGINPKLDEKLEAVSNALSELEKAQKGEIIELSAQHLPENSEEEKKRKRALLLFINIWKQLQSEVARVQAEIDQLQDKTPTTEEQISSFGRIIMGAKGPLGAITIIALIVVGFMMYGNSHQEKSTNRVVAGSETTAPIQTKVKGIIVNENKIPLSEVYVGTGTDCDNPHYHALSHTSVKTLEGKRVADPGGCGFGKVKDVPIVDIE